MKTYRYRHAIEALRWTDTDAKRAECSTWFEKHDAVFETRGPEAVLPEGDVATEGDWILFSDVTRRGEFTTLTDEEFRFNFAEIP